MKKSKQSFSTIRIIFYSLILLITFSLIVRMSGSFNQILPCFYTSERGLPSTRLVSFPQKLEVDLQDDAYIVLYPMNLAGEQQCYFSSHDRVISLSPNKQYIAFEISTGYPQMIGISSITGEEVVQITANLPSPSRFPIWSPDSQYLAFSYGDIGGAIYIASRDGLILEEFNLEGVTFHSKDWASWSQDSNYLAFSMIDGPEDSEAGIYLLNRITKEMIQLTYTATNDLHSSPIWSETGEEIIYLANGTYNTRTNDYEFDEQCVISIETRLTDCEKLKDYSTCFLLWCKREKVENAIKSSLRQYRVAQKLPNTNQFPLSSKQAKQK